MASYNIYLTDDYGAIIPRALSPGVATLNDVIRLEASREANRVGALYLVLPPTLDVTLLERDKGIQVWRAPSRGRMTLFRHYFIRRWRLTNQGGEEQIHIWGYDALHLLTRRIVAAYAGADDDSSFTNEYSDDLLKELVSDAMSDALSPAPSAGTRAWSALSVAGDRSAGPQVTTGVTWKKLLTRSGGGALPKVVEMAAKLGTPLYFDVVPSVVTPTEISFRFVTAVNQPGRDLTTGKDSVIFSLERGNLANPSLDYDYRDEVNYVYAGGKGEEDQREIQQAYDDERYNISRWNRCEDFKDARNQSATNAVLEAAREEVERGQGQVSFKADLLSTPGSTLGRDWGWGDKVVVKYQRQEIESVITSVVLLASKGEETVKVKVTG